MPLFTISTLNSGPPIYVHKVEITRLRSLPPRYPDHWESKLQILHFWPGCVETAVAQAVCNLPQQLHPRSFSFRATSGSGKKQLIWCPFYRQVKQSPFLLQVWTTSWGGGGVESELDSNWPHNWVPSIYVSTYLGVGSRTFFNRLASMLGLIAPTRLATFKTGLLHSKCFNLSGPEKAWFPPSSRGEIRCSWFLFQGLVLPIFSK